MSIASEINRIKSNIADAYTEAEAKGATMPATENSDNLADTVASIPSGSSPTLITKRITANDTYTAEDDNVDGYSEVTVNVPDASKTTLDALIQGNITRITSNVLHVRSYAFFQCSSLISAVFPSIDSMSQKIFEGCSSLKTIECRLLQVMENNSLQDLPALENVEFPLLNTIRDGCFSNCTSLETVDFPLLESIGDRCFSNCTSLTTINVPSLETIGDNSFYNCTSLTTVNLPSVKSIGDECFLDCAALTTVNLSSVTSIGDSSFEFCTALETVDMSENLGIPTIGEYSFGETTCFFLFKDQEQLDAYASATNWSALADRFKIKEATL